MLFTRLLHRLGLSARAASRADLRTASDAESRSTVRSACGASWPRLASLCAVCHGWGAARVCDECVARFAVAVPRCERCAIEVPPGVRHCSACLADPPPHARALAAVDYGYPWNELIGHFKFHAALDLSPALAHLVLEAQRLGDLPAPTLIVPIPLSSARLRERGYNQSWELARRIAPALRCPADARLLLRVRDTPHQIALPPDRRDANVRGAFVIEPLRRAELQARDITLIDDVMTTGATLAEASRVLLQAGAASVQVWVVARTPER